MACTNILPIPYTIVSNYPLLPLTPSLQEKPPGRAAETEAPPLDLEEGAPTHRKGSILRAASALAGGIEEQEDITYQPIKIWTKQPTTQELIQDRVNRREVFGWEVDFHDFKMPFQKNVDNKVIELGGFDEDD